MADGNATNCVTSRARTSWVESMPRLGTVTRRHGDDGVHAVDVEEERDHEDEQDAIARDAAHGGEQPGERLCDVRQDPAARIALLAVTLLVGAQQGHGERQPPQAGDDKSEPRAGERVETQDARPAENERDAEDERDGRAHVTPCVTRAGDCVHPLVGGDVGEHGVVERHRRVEAYRAEYVDHEEDGCAHGNGLSKAQNEAGEEKAGEELNLVAGVIGEGAQDGHKQGDDERCDGLGVGPGGHELGRMRPGVDSVEVDGDHRGVQQHERGISHIVHDPVAFHLRIFHRVFLARDRYVDAPHGTSARTIRRVRIR